MAACRYHHLKPTRCTSTNCPMVGVIPHEDVENGFSRVEEFFDVGYKDALLLFFTRGDKPTLETRKNIAKGLYMVCKLWAWDPLGGPLKKYNQLCREIQDLLNSGVSDLEPDGFEFSSEWESVEVPLAQSGRSKDSEPVVCGLFSCLGGLLSHPCLYHRALSMECDPDICPLWPIFPPGSSSSFFQLIFDRFFGDRIVEKFFWNAGTNPMTLSLLARQTIFDSLLWESQEWKKCPEKGGPLFEITTMEKTLAVLQHNKKAGSSKAVSKAAANAFGLAVLGAGAELVSKFGGTVEARFPPYDGKVGQKCRGEMGVHSTKPIKSSGRPLLLKYRVEHADWKPTTVISGHKGWVRCVAVHPNNTWFCTGSADHTIKTWDLANGRHLETLTGHFGQVRGVAISSKHSCIYSAGNDGVVNCWDVEKKEVIHSYWGHRGVVFSLALHPTEDVLLSGGQDSVCRVWDIRSKKQIHALSGHEGAVNSVFTRPTDPQVITGSSDKTIKLWDLRFGEAFETLKRNRNYVLSMAPHPTEDCFVAASHVNDIKKFDLPLGKSMVPLLPRQTTEIKTGIYSMAVNGEGVLATAGANGSLWFWDLDSGYNYQKIETTVHTASLPCEACIYSITFDKTGSKLITCEADKTIKMWEEEKDDFCDN